MEVRGAELGHEVGWPGWGAYPQNPTQGSYSALDAKGMKAQYGQAIYGRPIVRRRMAVLDRKSASFGLTVAAYLFLRPIIGIAICSAVR